jgi:hypothetical protein
MAMPFVATSRRGQPWFSAGLASSFPDVTNSGTVILSDQLACDAPNPTKHSCKVFLAPDIQDSKTQAIQLSDDPKDQLDASLRQGDQVLIFQYKGKFHAIDNVRWLRSLPCSTRIRDD